MGRWITCKGRKIFIEDGESVESAMMRNGMGSDSSSSNQSKESSSSSNGSKQQGTQSKEEKIKELEDTIKNGTFRERMAAKRELQALKEGKTVEQLKKEKEEAREKAKSEKEKRDREKESMKQKPAEEKKNQEQEEKLESYKFNNKPSSYKKQLLQKEREKYDSDEEFENSFTKLYHGGSKDSVSEISKNVEIMSVKEKNEKFGDVAGGNIFGLSTATSENSAKEFSMSRNNKEVAYLYLSKDAKVITIKGSIDDLSNSDIVSFINKGYDAINVPDGGENEIRILNPNKIFTKSQLESVLK